MKKLNIQKDVQSRESIAQAAVYLPAQAVVEPLKLESDDKSKEVPKPTSDQAGTTEGAQKRSKTRGRKTQGDI